MFKRILCALLLTVNAASLFSLDRFKDEELAMDIYISCDPSKVSRITMQKLEEDFILYLTSNATQKLSKRDALYIKRLSEVMHEISYTYHYGV